MIQKSTRWENNEIILTADVNDNSNSLIENADKTFNILGPNMVVTGFVASQLGTPGMAVQITEGIVKSEQTEFLLLGDAFSNVSIAAADPVQDRRDTVEIRRIVTDISPESRQFKDPNTGVISVSSINTEQEYSVEVNVLTGTPGGSAPAVESGWEKLVEILVPASSTTVVDANIYNVDAVKTGDSNTDWTTDATSIYRNGSISDMNDSMVKITEDQTIAGVKTFSSIPIVPSNPVASGDTGAVRSDDVYDYIEILKDLLYPIGMIYTQFPTKGSPTTLGLPGTWTNISSEYAGDFFRAEGGDASAFESGEQLDAFQGHWHDVFSQAGGGGTSTNEAGQGLNTNSDHADPGLSARGAETDGASGTPRTDSETRPVNRTIVIWERTS